MNFYDSAFLVLITGCGLLTWQQYHKKEPSLEEKALTQNAVTPRSKAEASQFTRLFLAVYCLVMASDWLQGMFSNPYSFSIPVEPFDKLRLILNSRIIQAHMYTVYTKINSGFRKE